MRRVPLIVPFTVGLMVGMTAAFLTVALFARHLFNHR